MRPYKQKEPPQHQKVGKRLRGPAAGKQKLRILKSSIECKFWHQQLKIAKIFRLEYHFKSGHKLNTLVPSKLSVFIFFVLSINF